jgi:hypothetical protein
LKNAMFGPWVTKREKARLTHLTSFLDTSCYALIAFSSTLKSWLVSSSQKKLGHLLSFLNTSKSTPISIKMFFCAEVLMSQEKGKIQTYASQHVMCLQINFVRMEQKNNWNLQTRKPKEDYHQANA